MKAYIYIIRTLFWTVAMSGFLQVNSVYATALNTINLMQKDIKCPSDSIFYTPVDVTEQCIATALRCVEVELQHTVKGECNYPIKRIDQGLKVLRKTMEKWKVYSKHNQRKVCHSVCEEWPERSFRVFLNKTKDLVQLVYDLSKSVT